MALELLVQKIRKDADREVQAILAEAETKASAIEAKTRARAEAIYKRELQALRLALDYAARQEVSQREIEIRATLLQERENLLDQVRAKWTAWLHNLTPGEETQILQGLMAKGRACVGQGVIHCSPRASQILGPQPGFSVKPDAGAPPGLQLTSADGHITADLFFPSLIEEFWPRHRPAAAATLFGGALTIQGPEETK
ncbi:MAG TPA: V-type ATP synthase subunit E [Candidatus Brocadiia bacterium]|nr:V-type ATP synthase subunit E [Candidatus Brocadiia bacterium]